MKIEPGKIYYCERGVYTSDTIVVAISMKEEEECSVVIRKLLPSSYRDDSAKIGQTWDCPKTWLTPIDSTPNASFLLKKKGIKL
jgi:hypothetical protein